MDILDERLAVGVADAKAFDSLSEYQRCSEKTPASK